MELFKLFGTIAVNNSEANQNIEETSEKASGFSDKLENGIKTAAKWGAGIVAGASVAIGGITKFAESSAAAADNVDKMSQKIGISRQAYQELDFICSQSGTSVDTLQAGMKTLTSAMDKAASGTKDNVEQFQRLGVSVKNADGSLRSQEEVMWETLSALQGMENQTEKARLATELFGRSGTELMPLLNGASGSIEEMKTQAHELGLVMDDELVDSGVELTDALDQTKRQFKAIITQLGAKLMPTITSKVIPAMQKLLKTIGQNAEKLMNALIPAFDFLIDDIFPILINLVTFLAENFKEVATVVGLVVAAFEALKVISTVSTAISGATTAMGALNAVMAANPVGAVVTGVVALGAAVAGLVGILGENKTELELFIDEVTEYWAKSNEIWDELGNSAESRLESLASGLSDTSAYATQNGALEGLRDNLALLVDSEGNVLEGHESQVEYILGELQNAYGIEADFTGTQIENYDALTAAIDNTLKKKEQEAMFDNLLKKKTEAEEGLAKATADLSKAQEQYYSDMEEWNKVSAEYEEKVKTLKTAQENYQKVVDAGADGRIVESWYNQVKAAEQAVSDLQASYDESKKSLEEHGATFVETQQAFQSYSSTIEKYGEVQTLIVQGETDKSIEVMKDYATQQEIVKTSTEQNATSMTEAYLKTAQEYGRQISEMEKYAEGLTGKEKESAEKSISAVREKLNITNSLYAQAVADEERNAEREKSLWTGLYNSKKAIADNFYGSVKDSIVSSGKSMLWLSQKNGEYMMDGIAQGAESKLGALKTKLESMGKKLPSYMQVALKINSPSKLMADEVGQWIPAGIGVGIEENEDAAIEPLQGIADNVVSAGVSKIVPNVASSVVSNIDESSNETSNDNLIQKFDELLAAIKGMKVVMQSGALVGEIATDMC